MTICLMLLSGCSTTEYVTVTETVVKKQYPPEHWLAECGSPVFIGNSNQDLMDYVLVMRTALNKCNEDKAALKEWAERE